MTKGRVRAGIGGWVFEPWRGVFYPEGLIQAKELAYAASRFTAIEINSTYRSLQKPETFAKWAAQAPEDFLFAVKGSRFCTNRKVLAGAGEAVDRFLHQGLAELGDKLGPILWQFMPTKKFDREDFAAFLDLLPAELDGRPLRHALEVRHESFKTPAFIDLARERKAVVVTADSEVHPFIGDLTGDFVYARLQAAREAIATGYSPTVLDRWARRARAWAGGRQPFAEGLVHPAPAEPVKRDVFVFMINGAKVRAPAAAQAFLERL
jgi:uncharacterized protein YecE (DUF72 family)